VANFPDNIQDLKDKFTVTRHGHTKLYLPAHLVKRYSSNSKELSDVEIEAMKKRPDSHSDMAHVFKSSLTQENISGGCANGDINPRVIVSQPKPPTQHVAVPEDNPHNLEVGSLVQFGSPPCYGEIKWMGSLPNVDHTMGGVEVVCL